MHSSPLNENSSFEVYNFTSIKDGFTQRAITSIFKDADGYLWISTYGDGLFRYNGLDFKNYKQERNAYSGVLNVLVHILLYITTKFNSVSNSV